MSTNERPRRGGNRDEGQIDQLPASREYTPKRNEVDISGKIAFLNAARRVLSTTPFATLYDLVMVRHNVKTGRCDPRQETIASDLNLSTETVGRALKELRNGGWITVHQRRHRSAEYEIHWDRAARPVNSDGSKRHSRSVKIDGSRTVKNDGPRPVKNDGAEQLKRTIEENNWQIPRIEEAAENADGVVRSSGQIQPGLPTSEARQATPGGIVQRGSRDPLSKMKARLAAIFQADPEEDQEAAIQDVLTEFSESDNWRYETFLRQHWWKLRAESRGSSWGYS